MRHLPALALLLILTALAWWLPNREQAGEVPLPTDRFNSVSFAPFRPGQSPLRGVFPSAAEVEADMALVPFDDRDGVIWMDGAMVPWRDARLHVLTHGLHYASGVFEGERAYSGHIFKLREHTERLINSAAILGFEIPYAADQIDAACQAVLAANGSGTVARSRRDQRTLLNVDIGGGTTKLALVLDGQIVATAAVAEASAATGEVVTVAASAAVAAVTVTAASRRGLPVRNSTSKRAIT